MGSPEPDSPGHAPNSQHGLGVGHPGRRRSGLRSRGTQLLVIRFGWVVLVIWYEVSEPSLNEKAMLIAGRRGKRSSWTFRVSTDV
jgi:hypothetical protein